MAKRPGRRRRWPWVVLAVIVAIGGLATFLHWPAEGTITISRETTYILGPVNADGTVNYVAYINQRLSEGVTKDNNAAIPLIRAFGPEFLPSPVRGRILNRLDMPPLPMSGKYFIMLDDWLDSQASTQSADVPAAMPTESEDDVEVCPEFRLEKACEASWAKADFPQIAAWLDAQAKPLELVIAASRRSRYYMPLLSPDNPPQIFTMCIPSLSKYREASKALSARAMLKLGADDLEGAWADILTAHRIGALPSNGGTVIEHLGAITIQKLTASAGSALATSGKLSAAQARAMLADLQSLPPSRDINATINEFERFVLLDCVMMLSRLRKPGASVLGLPTSLSVGQSDWNWDEMLRICNSWWDRMEEAGKKPTRAERSAAWDEIEQDVEAISSRVLGAPWRILLMKLGGRATSAKRSKLLAELLLTILAPSLSRCRSLQDQAIMGLEVEKLAFALAAHRAEKGEYPAALSELSPAYLKEIPNDLFTDKPLKYRRVGKGYVLYSVGENLTDDDGEMDRGNDQDDIGVRVEPAE